MEIDHHFDPMTFCSTDNDLVEVKPASDAITIIEHDQTTLFAAAETTCEAPNQGGHSTENSSNLRRSGRPKPAAESLLSSPPAIKFYESTVIRKSSDPKKRSASSLRAGKSSANTNGSSSPSSQSKTLKLRLADSNTSTSKGKENENSEATPKSNLRVVKLMMPDVTEEDTSPLLPPKKSQPTSPVKLNNSNVKVLPLLAPKPPATAKAINDTATIKEFKLRERKSNDAKTYDAKTYDIKTDNGKTDNVNEDVCSSCGGLGNFICCDACPRSFHFTCAEPPLDPQNLPENDWYCNECQCAINNTQKTEETAAEFTGIWGLMRGEAGKINPKCFVMPRRFRYQPKEEDLIKIQTGQLMKSSDYTAPIESRGCIVIDNVVKIDHCGVQLSAPNISTLKAPTGYCHCCDRFGLTRAALSKVEELNGVPGDSRYHRPMLSCSVCPLYWHLDCLDPPLASFPSTPTWTCPIHFTSEHCLALNIAESLVQSTALLPESAIQLQFRRKAHRMRTELGDGDEKDGFEEMYGVKDCINVPENIKLTYQ